MLALTNLSSVGEGFGALRPGPFTNVTGNMLATVVIAKSKNEFKLSEEVPESALATSA